MQHVSYGSVPMSSWNNEKGGATPLPREKDMSRQSVTRVSGPFPGARGVLNHPIALDFWIHRAPNHVDQVSGCAPWLDGDDRGVLVVSVARDLTASSLFCSQSK